MWLVIVIGSKDDRSIDMLLPTARTPHHHPGCSSKAPADDGASVGDLKRGNPAAAAGRREEAVVVIAEAAVDVCLTAAAVAGAALLAWWAVAFHPAYAHLWMVPVGLVLACTPPLVCLALRFSGDGGQAGSAGAPPPLAAVVVHK